MRCINGEHTPQEKKITHTHARVCICMKNHTHQTRSYFKVYIQKSFWILGGFIYEVWDERNASNIFSESVTAVTTKLT